MKKIGLIILVALFVFGCGSDLRDVVSSKKTSEYLPDTNPPKTYAGMQLVWHEEFDVDGSLSEDDWNFELGFVRNKESQWYQKDNGYIKDHSLILEGRKDTVANPDFDVTSSDWRKNREYAYYTSACVTTKNKHSWKYGKIEVRAKIPAVDGAWPAIWTLGTRGQWPSCGEIDILEYYIKRGEPQILANFAYGTQKRYKAAWNETTTPYASFVVQDKDWANKFHVWTMDWNASTITLSIDGHVLNTQSTKQKNKTSEYGGVEYPFDQEHFLLLNLALGANGGSLKHTPFPLKYEIDYVRVYQ